MRQTLGLSRCPIAVIFCKRPPKGVPKFAGNVPSGCSFFGIAAGGMTFYTVAADHYCCPIGSYTWNLPLPVNHAKEMARSIDSLSGTCNISLEAIQSIPRSQNNPNLVVFSPLENTPMDPDVVVLVVKPLQGMIIQEAAMRKHIGVHIAPLSQPTCMSLHYVMEDKAVTTAGCMGNRVFNALKEEEMYMLLPGRLLQKVADELQNIATANSKLAEQYLQKRSDIEALLI